MNYRASKDHVSDEEKDSLSFDQGQRELQPLATGFDHSHARSRDGKSPMRVKFIPNQPWARKPVLRPVAVIIGLLRSLFSLFIRYCQSLKPGPLGKSKTQKATSIVLLLLRWFVAFVFFYATLCFLFFPSYTRVPKHYKELRRAVDSSSQPGRGNPIGERIMIAAALHDPDGSLLGGRWGQSVLDLIDILGPQNTLLSIYISDSGVEGTKALAALADRIPCSKVLKAEERVDTSKMAKVRLSDGTMAVKRIEYLAAARNIALEPAVNNGPFNKILFLNDVIFDPVEAAQLLFSTNVWDGRAQYRAACATDWANPFKFYDTFATRDLKGYRMGVPIYPWFAAQEEAWSRADVLDQKDAVRVRSCWGGMVAFDATFFQPSQQMDSKFKPLKFRAVQELDWEYSESCLIHADLTAAEPGIQNPDQDSGVFMNPYIRTAYSTTTFNWLWLGRRVERVFRIFQNPINLLAGLPYDNPRRTLRAPDSRQRIMWDGSGAIAKKAPHWVKRETPTKPGMFCGIHHLLYKRLDRNPGDKDWETIWMPDGVGEGRSIPGIDMQTVDDF